MAQVKWTEPALQDLDEIAEYIALDKPVAAGKLVRDVLESVKRLRDFPDSGKEPDELQGAGYREIVVGPCRIFYRHDGSVVYVLHLMRSERVLRRFMLRNRAPGAS